MSLARPHCRLPIRAKYGEWYEGFALCGQNWMRPPRRCYEPTKGQAVNQTVGSRLIEDLMVFPTDDLAGLLSLVCAAIAALDDEIAHSS